MNSPLNQSLLWSNAKRNECIYLKITMMKTKTQIILYLSILALIDAIVPIPFTALMLIYVIFEKPAWFRNLVNGIYNS